MGLPPRLRGATPPRRILQSLRAVWLPSRPPPAKRRPSPPNPCQLGPSFQRTLRQSGEPPEHSRDRDMEAAPDASPTEPRARASGCQALAREAYRDRRRRRAQKASIDARNGAARVRAVADQDRKGKAEEHEEKGGRTAEKESEREEESVEEESEGEEESA